ncbi:MAG: ABC transporter substrate-binding protein [Desulfobacterales bacterium]|jgi:branched-chain amino acid transport system substrate-binding protein
MKTRSKFVAFYFTFSIIFSLSLFFPGTSVLAAEPVKIGVMTPLSPPGATLLGQFIQRGAEMGAEYVNSEGGVLGGRQLELVIEDDSGTPEKGIAGYRRLVTQKNVSAVIGQVHSSVMLAVGDLSEKLGVPVFSTQASSKAITEKHLMTAFRTHAIDPDRARMWLQFIKETGYKRIGLLAENTDYGFGLVDETKAGMKALGLDLELKSLVFDKKVVDLTPQLLELKAWKPDLLIDIHSVPTSAYLMVKQAYDIGLFPSTPILASFDWPGRAEYWKNLGDKGNHILFISYYHPNMKLTDRGEWFKEQYLKKYGEFPIYAAFNGFGQILILKDALELAKSDKPADLINALEKGEFTSWNGTVTFERGDGPYWHQWSPQLMVLQYTQSGQSPKDAPIIYPPDMKTGDYKAP